MILEYQSGAPVGLFIDGQFVAVASDSTFEVVNPATEEVLALVADAGAHEAERAIAAAARAQAAFAASAPRERSAQLHDAYQAMMDHRDELAQLIVAENGKALSDAAAEVAYAAEFFRWYAEEAVRVRGEVLRAPAGSNRIVVLEQPIGPSLLVTPWNFPAAMLTRKIAPALAAGCTVVAKPAEETPLTALAIGVILGQAGVPAGVVNVIPTSRPAELVSQLIADARVRKLSFTGSTEVGRILLAQAAPRVLSCSMELGGNAPFLVFEDADLDAAIAGAMLAKLRNGGQACTSANRFLVHESIATEFAKRLSEEMSARRVGPGSDAGVEVGPLINEAAVENVERLVNGALDRGAQLLAGGERVATTGYFYPPTVLIDVPPDAAIVNEEIFGPVAPITTFATEDEAVALANATEFGLVAYLYTGDLARGLRVSEALECGMVGLNRGLVSDPAAPFGGTKASGLGREGGAEGIREFLEMKYVACSW